MHEYMTRRLIAMREMTYAEWPLRPGDEFRATPVDADYLTRHGRAKPAPELVLPAFETVQQQLPDSAKQSESEEQIPRVRRTYTRRNTTQG